MHTDILHPPTPAWKGDGVQWYASMNNRRLWVLKELRARGLLPGNKVLVKVRSSLC